VSGRTIVIRRDERGSYSFVYVDACHAHECPAWRMGKSNGPCVCGADAIMPTVEEAIVALQGETATADGMFRPTEFTNALLSPLAKQIDALPNEELRVLRNYLTTRTPTNCWCLVFDARAFLLDMVYGEMAKRDVTALRSPIPPCAGAKEKP
jgi:hypothetical protein